MQHSADFTSLHSYHADVARAEREFEVRRLADERRALAAEPVSAAAVDGHPHRRRRTAYASRPALSPSSSSRG